MNLIEKVAKAIYNVNFNKNLHAQFDTLFPRTKEKYLNEGKAAIEAMPSIKWQKIETLPEEYKMRGGKNYLGWDKNNNSANIACYYLGLIPEHYFTHWAEINAPEEE